MTMSIICTCGRNSDGSHVASCPLATGTLSTRPVEIAPPMIYIYSEGWVCPVCGGGNAPWSMRCPCTPASTYSSGSSSVFIFR